MKEILHVIQSLHFSENEKDEIISLLLEAIMENGELLTILKDEASCIEWLESVKVANQILKNSWDN
jgi:hypothetical protein